MKRKRRDPKLRRRIARAKRIAANPKLYEREWRAIARRIQAACEEKR
jgi:hypothetical protein